MNLGYIQDKHDVSDWRLGAVTGMRNVTRVRNGQWDNHLAGLELQRKGGLETMACVSFSLLNCLETIHKFEGYELNYSDRALAKMSGTTKNGNSMRQVADTARNQGLAHEIVWPFDD